jgi:hypothetical protein
MATEPTLALGFRFRWALLTAVGLAAGLTAGLLLGAPIGAVVGMMLVTPAVTAIVGASLGTSQWLALRHRLANARWWIAASAAGLGLGLAAGVVLVEQVGRLVAGHRVNAAMLSPLARAGSLGIVGAVAGLALGAAQGLILRRAGGARSWMWTSMLAFGCALAVASLLADFVFGGLMTPLGFATFALASGFLAGLMTASPLLRYTSESAATP